MLLICAIVLGALAVSRTAAAEALPSPAAGIAAASPSLATPLTSVSPGPLDAALDAQVRAFSHAATAALAGDARVELEVGRLDPRLRLAPCQRIEPFLPPGQRLWGRSRLGLRCVQGAVRWQVSLPITVKVWAPALVAATPLEAGQVIEAADLRLSDIDLTTGSATRDAASLVGRTLRRALAAGDAVVAEALQPRRWFDTGDRVALVAVGPGWRVSSEGEALTPGLDGQIVRIRTESGRVVSGRAVAPRSVEIRL